MIRIALGFLGIFIGTLTDIKTREVPDWVNFSMIAAGVGLNLLISIYQSTIWPILFSLAGLGAGYALGALMYYTGQWGGGDAKMIMGIGALVGLPFLSRYWSPPPFLVLFFICTVFAGALYGIAWMFFLMIKRRKEFWPLFKEKLHTKTMIRVRICIMLAVVLLVVLSLFLPRIYMILLITLVAIGYVSFYLSIAVKTVEQSCFHKRVSVSKLVEGDWVVGEITKGKKVLVPEGNPGLSKEQIAAIKKSGIKHITVKEGIPFVPSFLIAYLAAYYWSTTEAPLLFWM